MGLSPLGVRANFQSFIESAIGGNLVHESGRCYGEAGLLCETNSGEKGRTFFFP